MSEDLVVYMAIAPDGRAFEAGQAKHAKKGHFDKLVRSGCSIVRVDRPGLIGMVFDGAKVSVTVEVKDE